MKDGILEDACSTRTRMVAALGEKCSFAHRQVDEQPTKWSKSNNDKSAVAISKKKNWQERESGSQILVTIERGNLLEKVVRN